MLCWEVGFELRPAGVRDNACSVSWGLLGGEVGRGLVGAAF